LKEANEREEVLHIKLNTLTNIIAETQAASKNAWNSMIQEDELLSKIESLQARVQLLVESNQLNSDELRYSLIIKLLNWHEKKEKFKLLGKETIRSALNEKLRVFSENTRMKTALETYQQECSRLKGLCDSYEEAMIKVAEKHDKQQKVLEDMKDKCKVLEEKLESMSDLSKSQLTKFEEKFNHFESRESHLKERIDTLKMNFTNALNQVKQFKEMFALETNKEDKMKHEGNESKVQVVGEKVEEEGVKKEDKYEEVGKEAKEEEKEEEINNKKETDFESVNENVSTQQESSLEINPKTLENLESSDLDISIKFKLDKANTTNLFNGEIKTDDNQSTCSSAIKNNNDDSILKANLTNDTSRYNITKLEMVKGTFNLSLLNQVV